MAMYFKQLPINGYDHNFSYAIGHEKTGEIFLIDPDNYDFLTNFLREEQWKLKAIILTHGHFDHVGCAPQFSKTLGRPIYLHQADNFLLRKPWSHLEDISKRKSIRLGQVEIKIMETPGHTPGSVCLLVGNILLTGDTVFVGGCGRTDFPYSDKEKMRQSLEKIATLPDEIKIYPGHDYGKTPWSTVGREKEENRCFKEIL